ncbi:TIGR02444 family protein [Phenylobacterium sp.]|jgi:uncharacterized protein (TIGR02444 family)|uniref:TIGR02444 family protein n=1 Tax=Phenylobacterium sp. TaxID=1871053 RepID=UPI000C89C42C|nr:TIGR02444 family protein [Phenylobacterium sp.]MAK83776.1 TIGR02444 family protein [Phenylobacterium sp.]|tara:strand:- start:6579 stop:7049 length:471 start_codon:yes stop_codon:yes gene_type:complete
MDLWSWAVSVYGRPGVAEAALALQDDHGQCVPLLLWAVFARPTQADLIGRAVSLARAWEAAAILPLRVARRGLKAELAGVEAPAREALRARVKAAELESERLLLSALADLDGGGQAPLEAALAAVATAWGGIADPAALDQLSRALSGPLPDPGKTG